MQRLIVVLLFTLPLLAQTPAPPPAPIDLWTHSLGAGLALTSGNSDTTNLNIAFNTAWDPKTDRTFKADALYLLGETNGEKQVDKSTASARYERLFQTRAFWFGEVQYMRDPFRDVAYLISPLAGAGYNIISTDTRKLSVDGAIGAVIEDNESFGRDTSGALKGGEAFEWALSPTSKVTQKLTGLWKADDFEDALYHFEAGVASTIASRLELKVSYLYDYKNRTPSPEIEKGDSALFAALLVKF
jgi:putative salt-induced outer membrane protein YdiY